MWKPGAKKPPAEAASAKAPGTALRVPASDAGQSKAQAAPGAYSALAVCGLSFLWLGALVGTVFIASAAQAFAAMPPDVALAGTLARLTLFTKIEIGLSLSVAVAQLYARAGRVAWIVYGCVLAVLLIEIGWLQPTLADEVRRVVEGQAENPPMAYVVHLVLDGGRAAGLLALGMLSFRGVSARLGLGAQGLPAAG